jgi:hypothetical protein
MKKGGITSTAVIWRKVGKIDKNGQKMDTKHKVEKKTKILCVLGECVLKLCKTILKIK